MNLWRLKGQAFLVHFIASLMLVTLPTIVALSLWFPHGLWRTVSLEGALPLMLLVDLVIGPGLTLVLFNPSKSGRELTLDLFLVLSLQVGALCYGLHQISQTRVAIVYAVPGYLLAGQAQHLNTPDQYAPALQPSFFGPRYASFKAGSAEFLEIGLRAQQEDQSPIFYGQAFQAVQANHLDLWQYAIPLEQLYALYPTSHRPVNKRLTAYPADTAQTVKALPLLFGRQVLLLQKGELGKIQVLGWVSFE
ncbi:hypothetical protein [Parvibium lacunae]|uniref:Pilus assembly protein n=1 Tax=Parvibium lacunae TaxID=1888893 RepID=A0A368L1M1_9BURK|nr:hypothetical protein [Parvibium lacunae]RCS57459.1 hypothetical protein DU000_08360 [Parvibium lacunae]